MNVDGLAGEIHSLEATLSSIQPEVAKILDRALRGHDLEIEEAVVLLEATGREFAALTIVADELRSRVIGDVVTYVVNRNINFTNVCIKRCGFCAFSRDHRQEEGYFLPLTEILQRAKDAWDLGATEVCIQAGLPPKMKGDLYVRICSAIKEELPDIHIHGFSPEEVLYGAVRSGSTIRSYLQELQQAGVGSLPGTSAEILDQELRDYIAPGRITVDQWIEVIRSAHSLGIPTTATMMFGHVETGYHVARHLALIRDIQISSGGFTEFVPLGFVHTEAPMYLDKLASDVRSGPSGLEVLRVHAVARLMLNNWIPNLQVSWVKEGQRVAQLLLSTGANDLGGTLINESISTSAGAAFGQFLKPRELHALIREAGRIPAERTTLYQIRKQFDDGVVEAHPLDMVEDPEQRFGSYSKLVKMSDFRFSHPRLGQETQV